MPGSVVGKSLNLGYVGKVSRNTPVQIGARVVKSILDGSGNETQPSIPFGAPVVVNTDNTFSKFGATGTGVSSPTVANFGGFAVAEVKQSYVYLNANGNGSYAPQEVVDVLSRGTLTAYVKDYASNAPVTNGQVYICTAVGNSSYAVGDLFATATPTSVGTATVTALTGARFTTGKVDANGVVEITLLTQAGV